MLFIRTIKNQNNIIFSNTILLFSLPSDFWRDFCSDPSLMSTWTNVKVDLKILHVSSDSKYVLVKSKEMVEGVVGAKPIFLMPAFWEHLAGQSLSKTVETENTNKTTKQTRITNAVPRHSL